jgi:hypothetical protein
MAAPAIDTTKIAIGYGILWVAAGDTAKPTTVFGGDLGATVTAWDYIGATAEGVTWGKDTEPQDHFVEESSIAVKTMPGTGRFAFETQLAEITPANVQLALGGGGTLSGAAGSEQIIPSETLIDYAITFDAVAPGTNKIMRIYVPRARVLSSLEVPNRRAEAIQLLNVEIVANCAFTEIAFNWGTAS